MKTILFVCIGNLCRSPMAEYLFNHHNENKNWIAKSAGIQEEGYSLDDTTQIMKEKNIDLTNHKSKKINKKILEEAEIIYALAPEVIQYLPKEKTKQEFIIDPYYQQDKFKQVRDEIEQLVKGIIKKL